MTFDPMSVEVTCVTLPKDHCVQVPWQYINVCRYSDQFCKIPHTYTYIHTTYYVQNEWSHSLLLNSVQARQRKVWSKKRKITKISKSWKNSEGGDKKHNNFLLFGLIDSVSFNIRTVTEKTIKVQTQSTVILGIRHNTTHKKKKKKKKNVMQHIKRGRDFED